MKNVLFVCTGNVDRSPTAQALFDGSPTITARSAGTAPTAPTQLTAALIDWADIILAMEPKHRQAILRLRPDAEPKVICLDIPNIYRHGEPKLKHLLAEKLRQHL